MIKYVIDASVVLKALLEKDSSTSAHFHKVLLQVEEKKALIFVPHLLSVEVANGLRFSVREKEKAAQKLLAFSELPLLFFEIDTQHALQILALSYDLGTTVYDTTYHQIALLVGGTFLTADKKYVERAKNLGSIQVI